MGSRPTALGIIRLQTARPIGLLAIKERIAAKVTRWLSKAPSPRPGGGFAGRISLETPPRRGLRAGKCDFCPNASFGGGAAARGCIPRLPPSLIFKEIREKYGRHPGSPSRGSAPAPRRLVRFWRGGDEHITHPAHVQNVFRVRRV